MPEKPLSAGCRIVTPRSPPMTVLYSRLSLSWSRRSSAPFPKERKTRSEKRKPCGSQVNCFAGPSTRRSEDNGRQLKDGTVRGIVREGAPRLGLRWDDYSADAVDGRLPHDTALRLIAAVEPHHALAAKLLTLLRLYCQWYEHPDRVPTQMQQPQFVGSVPGMAGKVGHWALDKRQSRLVLS